MLINGRDCIIAKIRPDGKPIYPLARYYAEELSDIDKAIECNLLAIRNPWIILATPENRKRLADYLTRYLNDEISLSINPDDINSLQILQTNANYIIDKLEVEKTQTLHEALDELGFDNCGQIGDRAVVAEVSLNNAQTQGINDLYNQCAKQIEKDVKDTLNLEIKFTPRMRDFPILSNKINQTIEGKAETDIKEASNGN